MYAHTRTHAHVFGTYSHDRTHLPTRSNATHGKTRRRSPSTTFAPRESDASVKHRCPCDAGLHGAEKPPQRGPTDLDPPTVRGLRSRVKNHLCAPTLVFLYSLMRFGKGTDSAGNMRPLRRSGGTRVPLLFNENAVRFRRNRFCVEEGKGRRTRIAASTRERARLKLRGSARKILMNYKW